MRSEVLKVTTRRIGAAIAVVVLVVSTIALSGGAALAMLRPGDAGQAVKELQVSLTALGYYSGVVDGHFGPGTKRAVMSFQKAEGLFVDGLVGASTQKRLAAKAGVRTSAIGSYTVKSGDTIWSIARTTGARPAELIRLNELVDASMIRIGQKLKVPQEALAARRLGTERPGSRVPAAQPSTPRIAGAAELLPWSEASKVYPNGAKARVIDVETGLSLFVRRLQGTYHADSEPVTAADTAVLRQMYGGKWSWNRRAVWVEVGGRLLAASINGYPHGREGVPDNKYPGHFCIHFLGSRLHSSGRVDPDHQKAVRQAELASRPVAGAVSSNAPPALAEATPRQPEGLPVE